MKADDPEELVRPAVDGTVGVIKSIKKYNKDIKRVVVTSSVAAVLNNKDAPYSYTESDWNEWATPECKEKGKEASGAAKYLSSKTEAEKAAWAECKDALELVTINPCIIYGPILHECDSPEKLNTSVAKFYGLYHGQVKESDLPGGGSDYVDVRDGACFSTFCRSKWRDKQLTYFHLPSAYQSPTPTSLR
jgi:nucleoside-diphosphate-sugar epimerase